MPVNWAFPAAQGEPESFLADSGFDLLLQVRCCQIFAAQIFCNRSIDHLLNVLVENFLLHAQKLSTPSPPAVH